MREYNRQKTRRYRERHPDRVREANRIPRERSAYNAEWAARNRADRKAYMAAYRLSRLEELRERGREWQRTHRTNKAVSQQKREALKLSAPGLGVSVSDWQEVLDASLGICAYCNTSAALTMDHIEPLSRGGAHDPVNIAAVCKVCNSSKHDETFLLWLAYRALARVA